MAGRTDQPMSRLWRNFRTTTNEQVALLVGDSYLQIPEQPRGRVLWRWIIAIIAFLGISAILVFGYTSYHGKTNSYTQQWPVTSIRRYDIGNLKQEFMSYNWMSRNRSKVEGEIISANCPCRSPFVVLSKVVNFWTYNTSSGTRNRVSPLLGCTQNEQICSNTFHLNYSGGYESHWACQDTIVGMACDPFQFGARGVDDNPPAFVLQTPYLQDPQAFNISVARSARRYLDSLRNKWHYTSDTKPSEFARIEAWMANWVTMAGTLMFNPGGATDAVFATDQRGATTYSGFPLLFWSNASETISIYPDWEAYAGICNPLYCDLVVPKSLGQRLAEWLALSGGVSVIIMWIAQSIVWPLIARANGWATSTLSDPSVNTEATTPGGFDHPQGSLSSGFVQYATDDGPPVFGARHSSARL